jgi:RNA polymerase sigma factor (sigma-70 family)
MRYRGYGLPIAEIVSEGNIGLMQAVKRFDPDRGVRLATHAMWWIRASIQEYILRSWSLVKIAASVSQVRIKKPRPLRSVALRVVRLGVLLLKLLLLVRAAQQEHTAKPGDIHP